METNNITKNSEDIFNYTPEFEEKAKIALAKQFAKPLTLEQQELFCGMYEAKAKKQKELFGRMYEANAEKVNRLINPILAIYRSLLINIIKHNKQQYMKYRKINNHKKNKQKWNANL